MNPTWTRLQNPFAWSALDAFAQSSIKHAEDGLLLNFFLSAAHWLPVQPPPQPDGTPVNMGPDNIPTAGITLDGQIYIAVATGTVVTSGAGDYSHDYSVLAKFDPIHQTFSSGRTISRVANGGHFIYTVLREAAPGLLANPPQGFTEPAVVMFGLGEYRKSNIYLSIVPKSEFESGVDASGNNATWYFRVSTAKPSDLVSTGD